MLQLGYLIVNCVSVPESVNKNWEMKLHQKQTKTLSKNGFLETWESFPKNSKSYQKKSLQAPTSRKRPFITFMRESSRKIICSERVDNKQMCDNNKIYINLFYIVAIKRLMLPQ